MTVNNVFLTQDAKAHTKKQNKKMEDLDRQRRGNIYETSLKLDNRQLKSRILITSRGYFAVIFSL